MLITRTIRLALIYVFLVLPSIFSSALIFPEYFSPFHIPLYLVSVIASLPFFYIVPLQLKKIIALLVGLLFFAFLVSGFWVDGRQFAVNMRQWFAYGSLYWCGIIGAIAFRMGSRFSVSFAEQMLVLFSVLFAYGVYTYYAQLFELPEFLYFLRPHPDLIADNIYSQSFSGWASAARAYSVWYEPSFSALILACSLPLLYFPVSGRIKVSFVLLAISYGYLTFSRSVWLIGAFFILGHFTGLFKFKLSRAGLVLMAMTAGIVITGIQVVGSDSYDEISALTRIFSIKNGMIEWLDNPLFGTGQAELIKPLESFGYVSHIHASIPIMLHWYGLIGLAIALIPYWYLADGGSCHANKAKTSFIYLSVISITVGGALLMMSVFWFFWGFYMVTIQQKEGK